MASKKGKRIRKPVIKSRLPPNAKAIVTQYRKKGYLSNPLLEDKQKAKYTLAKPLPDGRRVHIRIREGYKYITVEKHIDRSDPKRDPIGHLLKDVLGGVRTTKRRIRKKKKG